jgi:hypothetical protein
MDPQLAVCRLPGHAPVPEWATRPGTFFCATRSQDELSLVCESALIPEDVQRTGPCLAFKVEGPLAFSMVGVLTSLLVPLAEAHISVFVVSTFDTDYVLVRADQRIAATSALKSAGHEFM